MNGNGLNNTFSRPPWSRDKHTNVKNTTRAGEQILNTGLGRRDSMKNNGKERPHYQHYTWIIILPVMATAITKLPSLDSIPTRYMQTAIMEMRFLIKWLEYLRLWLKYYQTAQAETETTVSVIASLPSSLLTLNNWCWNWLTAQREGSLIKPHLYDTLVAFIHVCEYGACLCVYVTEFARWLREMSRLKRRLAVTQTSGTWIGHAVFKPLSSVCWDGRDVTTKTLLFSSQTGAQRHLWVHITHELHSWLSASQSIQLILCKRCQLCPQDLLLI